MRKLITGKGIKVGAVVLMAAMLMSGCGETASDEPDTIKVETLAESTQDQENETQSETVSELTLMIQVNDRIDYTYLEKALTYLSYRFDDVSYIENTAAGEDSDDSMLKVCMDRALLMRAMFDSLPVGDDGSQVDMGLQLIGDDMLISVENEESMPEEQEQPYAYYSASCFDDFLTLIGSTQSAMDMGLSWRSDLTDQIAVPASGFGGGEDYRVEMHSSQVRSDGIYVYYGYIVDGFEGETAEERAAKIVPDNKGSLGYKIEWIKLAEEAPAQENVSDQAEPESVYESKEAIEVVSVSEMVESAREETVDYTDSVGNQYHAVYRIPRILIDSEDAANVNAQLLDEMNSWIDEALDARDNGWSLTTTGIDYNAWVWNGTLTLFTTVNNDWGMEMHYIYTFDVNDGHRMDNAQIAALWGREEDAFYDTLSGLVYDKFVNMYGEAADTDIDFYDEQLSNSISEENIRSSVLYPDSNGSAMAAVTIYSLAGADAYEQVIGLGWE